MSNGTAKSTGDTSGEYQVLARRYRSRGFDEVIGQESIAMTLRNAIERNRTAHAYLFCGTRGVGKTSMARIFAKALNATADLSQQEAIGNAILRGEDIDVIEIDAASNNGVADARDLIANAGLMPARSRWKIYIIDEVHMLSTAAFNALLKTMEEPPEHVKFILCTTDPHKVLATIQSRCQRFDFKPIPALRIAAHMKAVLTREEVEADDEVVNRISRLANGSMRDGLTLLDRLIVAAQGRLDAELLESALGLVSQDRIDAVVDSVAEGDPAGVLKAGKGLLDEGLSIEQALDAMAERFRALMAARVVGADEELLGVGSEEAASITERSGAFDVETLVHLVVLCDAIASRTKFSGAARAVFDAGLVRMALHERFADAAALLEAGEPAQRGTKQGGSKKKRAVADRHKVTPAPSREAPPSPKPSVLEAKPASTPSPQSQAKAEPEPPAETQSEHQPQDAWAALVSAAESPMDRAILENLVFDRFENSQLTLRVKSGTDSAAGWIRSRPETLAPLVKRGLGADIKFEVLDGEKPVRSEATGVDELIRQREIVREAMDLFDATLVETRSPEEASEEKEA